MNNEKLENGQVLFAPESGESFRILWLSEGSGNSWWINLKKTCNAPKRFNPASVLTEIEDGRLEFIADPLPPLHADDTNSAKMIARRDRAWELIKDVVSKEPDVFEPSKRYAMLLDIEKSSGVKVPNIYKYLGRYWRGGKTPNALLPDYSLVGHSRNYTKGNYKPLGRPRKDGAVGKSLSSDDFRAFESAVRKYYLSEQKISFSDTYENMLKDSYSTPGTDADGKSAPNLLPADKLPTITQFRYWYKHNRSPKEESVAREGDSGYALKHRAVTGKTEQDIKGPGQAFQIDATIGDIYLCSVSDRTAIVGRPTIYFIMDAFSHIVVGMHISLDSPSWAEASLSIMNAAEDKVNYCRQFGITIKPEEWPCRHTPSSIIADRGEMESRMADRLSEELGISIVNTPPYRGDLKGIVEQHFRLINLEMSDLLPGKVKKDFGERQAKDYRLDATLDIRQFTAIIIKCVLTYNNFHYMKHYEKLPSMRGLGIRPIPLEIWNFGIRYCTGALRTVDSRRLRLALLPSGNGSVTEKGICFKKMYYSCQEAVDGQWFEKARENGRSRITVYYDPRNAGTIYARDPSTNELLECSLLEHNQMHAGKPIAEIEKEQDFDSREASAYEHTELDANVKLKAYIDSVISDARRMRPDMKGIPKSSRLANIGQNKREEAVRLNATDKPQADGRPARPAPDKKEEKPLSPTMQLLRKHLEEVQKKGESV